MSLPVIFLTLLFCNPAVSQEEPLLEYYVKHADQKIDEKTYFNLLPAEICCNIIAYLEPDDEALKFLLPGLKLNDTQIEALFKRYHEKRHENPERFFSFLPEAARASLSRHWRNFDQKLARCKEAIAANNIAQLRALFFELFGPIDQAKDFNLHTMDAHSLQKLHQLIEYRVWYLEKFHDFVKASRVKKSLRELIEDITTHPIFKRLVVGVLIALLVLEVGLFLLIYFSDWLPRVIYCRDEMEFDCLRRHRCAPQDSSCICYEAGSLNDIIQACKASTDYRFAGHLLAPLGAGGLFGVIALLGVISNCMNPLDAKIHQFIVGYWISLSSFEKNIRAVRDSLEAV